MVACGCREVQKARGGVHLIASHEMVVNLPHSLVHGSLLDDAAAKIQVVCHNGLQAAGSVRHEDMASMQLLHVHMQQHQHLT